MYRSSLALILSTSCAIAAAQDCSVAGKALGTDGKPMHAAIVRLTNLDTRQSSLSATDANADFRVSGGGGGQYRLDLLSPATVVTGSLIPTRSVLGMTADFSCRGGSPARQDVRAQMD
jgi:hypothetical protein